MFGENDQLLLRRGNGTGSVLRSVLRRIPRNPCGCSLRREYLSEQVRQFPPLGVSTALEDVIGRRFQTFNGVYLAPQFPYRLSGRRLIEDPLFLLFEFALR